jgi:predicted DNA binding CopG/RHH family protein
MMKHVYYSQNQLFKMSRRKINMKKKPKPETAKTKPINIMLPEELMERIQALCDERGMTIQDFVTDAIIEKLQLAHKERRKKVRL